MNQRENIAIRNQIRLIRDCIVDVLLEIDRIVLVENPRIEADYTIKIGVYQNELLETQISARRAKRKHTLAMSKVNSQKKIDEDEIEEQLDREMREWETYLQKHVDRYMTTLKAKMNAEQLTELSHKELKRLHRILVIRLHPDLNADQGEDLKLLFNIMQNAYQRGDVDVLRSIVEATASLDKDRAAESDDASQEDLLAELDRVEDQLHSLEEELEQIKSENPYAMKALLADEEWVRQAVKELKRQRDEQQQTADHYTSRYEDLVGGR